ncbi:hypothetical protein EYF80_041661 [Liparis tanakae]|uniref:Uncharacterized protein n=1 Tax=Liparis tanakae TaxID=230148 RepID=A0A4Z2G5J5_9TELE|nr:hypothetical protein EYF80_041661 [Liparis tanakae]
MELGFDLIVYDLFHGFPVGLRTPSSAGYERWRFETPAYSAQEGPKGSDLCSNSTAETGKANWELFVQLRCALRLRAVRAEKSGARSGAEHRAVRRGIEDLQSSGRRTGVNGGAAEAAVAGRYPGLLSRDGQGTLEGGFKQLLQPCRRPKM